jgi:hypothetical protein
MITRRGSRRLSVGIVLAALLSGMFATFCLAAGAAEPTPTLTSATVDPGGTDDVSGGGCVARSTVQVQLDGVVVVSVKSSATGTYTAHLVIPVVSTAGPHRITVVCAGPAGQLVATTTVTVTGNLPHTGSAAERESALALALLAFGAAAFAIAGRRRRPLRSISS